MAITPKSKLGEAIGYMLNQWPYLERYLETAKINGHEPYAWLRHMLTVLPSMPKGSDVTALLPMSITPESLKYPT